MHAERATNANVRFARVMRGVRMTTIQAVFFGIMVALAPSILLAFVLWLDEVGDDKKPDLG